MNVGQTVATVVYFLTVAGSAVFVAGRLKTPWKKYPEGRALLLQHVALVGLGGQVALALTIGSDHWWFMPLYIALLLTFGGSVWWLTYLQEKGRRLVLAALPPSPETHPPPVEDHQLG